MYSTRYKTLFIPSLANADWLRPVLLNGQIRNKKHRISNFQLLARKRTNNQQSVQNHQFIDQRTNARRTLNENISNEINKEASDVRDKYVRDQGMFGTKCKFGTSGNHFVAYVRDGQCIIQHLVPRKPQSDIRLKS